MSLKVKHKKLVEIYSHIKQKERSGNVSEDTQPV